VDFLRSCYSTRMRFGAAGAKEADVVWFFADDLPPLKRPTPYGSINWRGEGELPATGPGEVLGAVRAWSNGANPNPTCCTQPFQYGGARMGGRAGYWFDNMISAGGGLLLAGSGIEGAGFTSAGGGLLLAGSGIEGAGFTSAGGGLLLAGSGIEGAGFTSTGGLLLDGEGEVATGVDVADDMATGVQLSDAITFPQLSTDSAELGVRITDLVEVNPVDVADSAELGVRITDVVAVNPVAVGDSLELGVRITDVVAVNPVAVGDAARLAVRITDNVTTT